MRTRALVEAALLFGLALVSFMLFRGTTNFLNALTVPMVLYVQQGRWGGRGLFLLFAALFIGVLFFFRFQLFFIGAYFGLAVLLRWTRIWQWSEGLRFLAMSGAAAALFVLALLLTDWVFGLMVLPMLLNLSGGNLVGGALFFVIIGIVIATGLVYVSGAFDARSLTGPPATTAEDEGLLMNSRY